jgi:hypothetical protein
MKKITIVKKAEATNYRKKKLQYTLTTQAFPCTHTHTNLATKKTQIHCRFGKNEKRHTIYETLP